MQHLDLGAGQPRRIAGQPHSGVAGGAGVDSDKNAVENGLFFPFWGKRKPLHRPTASSACITEGTASAVEGTCRRDRALSSTTWRHVCVPDGGSHFRSPPDVHLLRHASIRDFAIPQLCTCRIPHPTRSGRMPILVDHSTDPVVPAYVEAGHSGTPPRRAQRRLQRQKPAATRSADLTLRRPTTRTVTGRHRTPETTTQRTRA